jgi:hypothetical protein
MKTILPVLKTSEARGKLFGQSDMAEVKAAVGSNLIRFCEAVRSLG